MHIQFWGTRGSLAKAGPTTVRYGGNTSCVGVDLADGTHIVFDCGTGAHGLGQALLASGQRPVDGHLLVTHTHWDHIQGFPFFAPLFIPGNTWNIYAPGGLGHHLEATLAGQMEYTYFPVTLGQLGATIHFHDLVEGSFALGSGRVVARYLNHPAVALGYRLEVGGVSVVYATDHEPHTRDQSRTIDPHASPSRALEVHQEELGHIAFLAEADLIIHDAQYTAEEYPQKVGWGHSTVEYTVDVAMAARAKRLALFHHDPLRDDHALERLVERCRERVLARHGTLEVFAAAEGQVLELPEHGQHLAMPEPQQAAIAVTSVNAAESATVTVLIVDDDPDIVRLLQVALRPEGFRLLAAYDGETALQLVRTERPTLVLMDLQMPRRDGLEVCRILRADPDPSLRDLPVVLLTGQSKEDAIEVGFAAGVTDYLTKPFYPAYVRSRVREWLLRTGIKASANS
ncbi:MAG: response regulator [Candidatus Tectomicrobia bacterium]|uniref:Response regulator n=1 Tax=Tectimicrobiota bacterium TaxID=2528274 RepID=A0A937W085_UNCTE|nr:response regulator [Candidatus Tectomicrobia bacterium]